jgi:hypothetical protein
MKHQLLHTTRMRPVAILAAATLACLGMAQQAEAVLYIDFSDIGGGGVRMTLHGSINTTGLTYDGEAGYSDYAIGRTLGPPEDSTYIYAGDSGYSSYSFFGTGAVNSASLGSLSAIAGAADPSFASTDFVGIHGFDDLGGGVDSAYLYLPGGPYVSGSLVESRALFSGTVAGLGVVGGTYFTLPNDTVEITLNGISAVPEPTGFLTLAGVLGIGGLLSRKRRC